MTNEGEQAITVRTRTCYLVGTRLATKDFQVAYWLEPHEGEDILELV